MVEIGHVILEKIFESRYLAIIFSWKRDRFSLKKINIPLLEDTLYKF